MKKFLILFISLALIFVSCLHSPEEDTDTTSETTSGTRTGAICNDGTSSTATGSGACSHHGGVDHWLYE